MYIIYSWAMLTFVIGHNTFVIAANENAALKVCILLHKEQIVKSDCFR